LFCLGSGGLCPVGGNIKSSKKIIPTNTVKKGGHTTKKMTDYFNFLKGKRRFKQKREEATRKKFPEKRGGGKETLEEVRFAGGDS